MSCRVADHSWASLDERFPPAMTSCSMVGCAMRMCTRNFSVAIFQMKRCFGIPWISHRGHCLLDGRLYSYVWLLYSSLHALQWFLVESRWFMVSKNPWTGCLPGGNRWRLRTAVPQLVPSEERTRGRRLDGQTSGCHHLPFVCHLSLLFNHH